MQKKDIKIIQRIKKIENGTFDEDDVKLLLIEIREKLKGETFLREVCHFVAHSDRDKGICHKKVDVRYAKFKFVDEHTKKVLTKEFVEQNKDKPERFFTDAMLSYISSEKIEKNKFELLIISGIDDLENEMFQKYYKLTKKQVKKLVTKAYRLSNGFYIPKTTITAKEFQFIDDILKFIRGTITGRPAFTDKDILADFLQGLKRLSSEIKYNVDFELIKKNKSDLIVCIISLLHDCTFKLFDGKTGSGFISIHPRENESEICLMSESDKYTLPLITTEIKANNYLDCGTEKMKEYEFKKLPWCNCIRNEKNELKLV
jgi:hypothetical protein